MQITVKRGLGTRGHPTRHRPREDLASPQQGAQRAGWNLFDKDTGLWYNVTRIWNLIPTGINEGKGLDVKDVGSMIKDVFRSLGLATQMGVMVVTSILACLFLGPWIDGKLHSYPWATLILIAVGTLVATVGAYRVVSPVIEEVTVEQRAEIPTKEILRSLVLVTRLALMAVGPVLIGLFLGLMIDVMLYTRPWVTLFLTALGIVVGLVGVYRLSSSLTEQLMKGDKKGDS